MYGVLESRKTVNKQFVIGIFFCLVIPGTLFAMNNDDPGDGWNDVRLLSNERKKFLCIVDRTLSRNGSGNPGEWILVKAPVQEPRKQKEHEGPLIYSWMRRHVASHGNMQPGYSFENCVKSEKVISAFRRDGFLYSNEVKKLVEKFGPIFVLRVLDNYCSGKLNEDGSPKKRACLQKHL